MAHEKRDVVEKFSRDDRMKAVQWLGLLIAVSFVYILFFAKYGEDGTILVGCSNVVKTRGGTICMDNAYKR